MKKETFVYGAAILVLSSIINRILGFIYQVFIVRLIGAEGIGLFSMVYPIYVLLIVISTAGIPVAVSKFVAEEVAKNNYRRVFKILKYSLAIMVTLSVIVTTVVYYSTPFLIGKVFPNPNVYWCFIALLPGIFIVAVSSAFRGLFQGLQQMKPTAISQTIEQLVRVISGLTIASLLLPKGIVAAAVGASLGVVLGELAGLLTMLTIFFKNYSQIRGLYRRISQSTFDPQPLLPKLFKFSIPVTLSRIISTIILSIEAIIIPQRLQLAGNSLSEATGIYGQYSGMALVLLFIPTVITISLATSLVPAISEALAQQNWQLVKNRSKEALRLTIISGLPSLVTFFLIPNTICDLLFKYPQAGEPLKYLALGGIFLFLQQTTTGIMQGLGLVSQSLRNLIVGALIKFGGIYFLTAMPKFGIIGTALAMDLGFLVVATLNILSLVKRISLGFNLREMVLKPGFAALLSGFYLLMAMGLLNQSDMSGLTVFTIILSQFCFYFVTLLVIGGVYQKDLQKLPFIGPKLLSLLRRLHFNIKN